MLRYSKISEQTLYYSLFAFARSGLLYVDELESLLGCIILVT